MDKRITAVLAIGAFFLQDARAGDWPMHRYDASRSGFSPETLPASLSLQWTYRPTHAPAPAWPRDERMQYDRANHVVAAGGKLFFDSSADGKVYALDAATGDELWTYFTAGPVRFAPAVWKDRLFVASDDGHLYCLAMDDGSLIQTWRGGPGDDRALGNGWIVSRWPVRGGLVLVPDASAGCQCSYQNRAWVALQGSD